MVSGRVSTQARSIAAIVVSAVCAAILVAATRLHQGSASMPSVELEAREGASRHVRFFTARHAERALSPAHEQMLAMTMLGCECQDITNIISDDNTWGHYTPKCCNKLKDKTSPAAVLGRDIQQAQANTDALRAALASAKVKLDKKLSVVVDAVTLKNGGRPGEQGPVGKKGPQGYVGLPGKQGARGPPGVVGPRGVQGHRGQIGYRGPTGNIGAKGTQGWEGTPGAPGYIGPDGPRGATGDEGPPGVQGAKGPVGNQGSLGRTGGTGAIGNRGPQGRELIFNGYIASTQCEDTFSQGIIYLDRFDVTCKGLLGKSFLNSFKMSRKCHHSWLKYERTCINAGTWRKAGVEGNNVNCNGWIRFGTGNKWNNAQRVNGWVGCNTHLGGDPAPGIPKECQCSKTGGAVDCSAHNTGCQYNGKDEYLDRQGVYCPSGKALTKYRARRCSGGQTTDFECCKPTFGMNQCQTLYTPCNVANGYPIGYLDRHNIKVSRPPAHLPALPPACLLACLPSCLSSCSPASRMHRGVLFWMECHDECRGGTRRIGLIVSGLAVPGVLRNDGIPFRKLRVLSRPDEVQVHLLQD